MNARRQKDRRNGSIYTGLTFTRGILIEPRLTGRKENRLPVIVVVRLCHGAAADTDKMERTCTDNISPSGARVFSKFLWHPGELVRITPVNEEPAVAEVVYCQHLPDDRYSLGLEFKGPATWSLLQRYARS